MTRPRLAFNALSLWPGGSGVQTYIVELLSALAGVVDADLMAAVRADAVDLLPPTVIPIVRNPGQGVRAILTEARGLGPAALVHGLDVHIPVRPRAPAVATGPQSPMRRAAPTSSWRSRPSPPNASGIASAAMRP
jgi:hypothetical protein